MEDHGNAWNRIRRAWSRLRLGGGAPALVLVAISTLFDWLPGEVDNAREGKIRAVLLTAPFLAYGALKRPLGRALAALIGYIAFMWVMRNYEYNGALYLINLLASCLVAWWLARYERLTLWLSIVGLFQACLGLEEFMGLNFWHYAETWALNKPTAMFNQETLLGGFLVACLPAALFTGRWWAYVPIAACILATKSSMSYAGLGVVVLVWIWAKAGWKPAAALCAAGACLLPWLPADLLDPNGRLLFWRFAIKEYVVKRPLFGFGPGFWWPQAPVVFGGRLNEGLHLTHIHNEFIEGQVELGAAGMGIVAAGLVGFSHHFRPTWHHATVAGILVVSVGNFVFHIAPIGVIFLTAWLLSIPAGPAVVFLSKPKEGPHERMSTSRTE
jgi:hypothetical protein